ncbi:MAG: hypothetical protein OXC26_11295 [Albidovulum sp.]|nr:hypothetical protein [Albidovulum sp.]
MTHEDRPMKPELKSLWNKAQGINMSREQRDEQRIQDVAANGNISDDRITVETTRKIHETAKWFEARE